MISEYQKFAAQRDSGSEGLGRRRKANHATEQLGAGAFVYYPAFQFHTICNATATPITYLMFKWTGPPRETEAPLDTRLSRMEDIPQIANAPFGGLKRSSTSTFRESGRTGLEFYTQIKTVYRGC